MHVNQSMTLCENYLALDIYVMYMHPFLCTYRICKDSAKEDMRGETVHLELRRHMHCASYNALIAIISNTQTDLKFYQQFIFSGDAAKVSFQ